MVHGSSSLQVVPSVQPLAHGVHEQWVAGQNGVAALQLALHQSVKFVNGGTGSQQS